MSDLTRRSVLATAATALPLLPLPPAHALPKSTIGEEDLAGLEAEGSRLTSLVTADRQQTRTELDAHLARVTSVIRHASYRAQAGARLHDLAARLAHSAAWQRFDTAQHPAAIRLWNSSLRHANASGNDDLAAFVVSDLAYASLWRGDPKTAAVLLEGTLASARHPAARALLHLRLARARADLGDHRACGRAIDAAEAHLAAPLHDPAPVFFAWLSSADLLVDTGRCLAQLGHTRAARRSIDDGMALLPATRRKSVAVFTTYQAESYLRTDEPEQAAHSALRALHLARSIDAPRCVSALEQLRPAFAGYQRITPVAEFLHALAPPSSAVRASST
ncbi:XRE family transcriptional regulator [Streptomyces sp. 5.8]|uniref:XRE family transcriptional regulator n=1 Tax=Streptomyces sp. 5.8 TaxID=3406571 RepID=UPI003BB686AF